MQAVSDSSDEGLGSMSPEPTATLISNQTNGHMPGKHANNISAKDYIELKNILDIERRKNAALEDRLREFSELHPVYTTNGERIYQQHEVVDHADSLRHDADDNVHTVLMDKVHHNLQNLHVVTLDSVSTVGQTQVVMCSPIEEETLLVDGVNSMHREHIDDEDSRTLSPCITAGIVKEEVLLGESRPQSPIETLHMQSHAVHQMKSVNTIRLQPILEAAIKAEPKVEVERIHSPSSITVLKECSTDNSVVATTHTSSDPNVSSRMYVTPTTSRQNLATIVEAIRHLEGEQCFGEPEVEPTQEVPLALTNKPVQKHHLQIEMNPFLQFRASSGQSISDSPQIITSSQINQTNSPLLQAQLQHTKSVNLSTTNASCATKSIPSPISTTILSSHINNRPGVIVVKQHS